ncbi:MAG: hypothetical protein U1F43_03625 [Myxococcota bacterium]
MIALTCIAVGGGACDAPGGGKTAIVGDVHLDATSSSDAPLFTNTNDSSATTSDPGDSATTSTPDTTAAPDSATPDTTVAVDTSTPDTTTSVCAQGCLPAVPVAGATVTFTQPGDTVPPPDLSGGAAPTGQWRLAAVDIYPYGTFVDGFTMTVENQGGTRGRANFSGDAMQVSLFLDLHIYVDAFGTTGDDTGSANVALGGCHEADDPYLVGDLASCASGWPDGVTPPSQLMYETSTGQLQLLLELEPDFLIAMLPEDQQSSASFVIVGPLVLVANLERP